MGNLSVMLSLWKPSSCLFCILSCYFSTGLPAGVATALSEPGRTAAENAFSMTCLRKPLVIIKKTVMQINIWCGHVASDRLHSWSWTWSCKSVGFWFSFGPLSLTRFHRAVRYINPQRFQKFSCCLSIKQTTRSGRPLKSKRSWTSWAMAWFRVSWMDPVATRMYTDSPASCGNAHLNCPDHSKLDQTVP